MVTNPPYGERISTPDLLGTYKMIGERLKHQFTGNDAWILSYREECFEQIGLKPSIKIPLFNGSLECEFRKYQLFDGKMREFREEGGVVKTEEEKRLMAEKRRFKQNREFKKRLDDEQENAEADIRNFKFRSLEKKEPKKPREPKDFRESRYSKDSRDFKDSKESRYSRNSKGPRNAKGSGFPGDFKKPSFKKNNRRFLDDDDED
jgi:putative N6-adenine-specific DNA methylase